jgi:hypothetical protein
MLQCHALSKPCSAVQAYEHAAALIAKFGELELTVKLLMQARDSNLNRTYFQCGMGLLRSRMFSCS